MKKSLSEVCFDFFLNFRSVTLDVINDFFEIEKNDGKKNLKERKTVLFRSITRFWALKKPCYLENRVVREPRKRRSACTSKQDVLELATLPYIV